MGGETPCEVLDVGKPDLVGDLLDRQLGTGKQRTGSIQAKDANILSRRSSCERTEQPSELPSGYIHMAGDLLE